jgi:hypothetical protein
MRLGTHRRRVYYLRMKLRYVILAAATAFAAACNSQEPGVTEPDPEAAAQVGEAEPLPHTLPPPSADTPRYVGLWATTQEGCAEPAWRWEAERVTTRGEVSCNFDSVEQTPTGYALQSTCYAEAPPAPYTIQLSFAESARAMMIDGGPWSAPTSLVYCGPLS